MFSSSVIAVSRCINRLRRKTQITVIDDDDVQIANPIQGTRLKKFSLFSELPVELKIIIWKYALPPPRAIRIAPGPVQIPRISMLYTCRLSREIAMQKYTLMTLDRHTTTYLDLTYDILLAENFCSLLNHTQRNTKIPTIQLKKVKHLAINIHHPRPPQYTNCNPAWQRSLDDEYFRVRVMTLWGFTMGYTKKLSNLATLTVFGQLGREEGEKFAGYIADHIEKFGEGSRPEVRYLRYGRFLSLPTPPSPLRQPECSQKTWRDVIAGFWQRLTGPVKR